jgi:hypothetical protein
MPSDAQARRDCYQVLTAIGVTLVGTLVLGGLLAVALVKLG